MPTTRTSIPAITATSKALGTELPKAIAAAHERLVRITAGYTTRANGQGDALTLAVLDAIDAGRDVNADPAVQRVITAQTLDSNHALSAELDAILSEQVAEAVRLHADAVVKSWRMAFATASTDLAAAHAALEGTSLADTDSVVRRGPAAAEAWGRATGAMATLATIDAGWVSLCFTVTGAFPSKNFAMLRIAAVDAGQWLDLGLEGRSADPWAALGDGLSLALPDLDAYRQTIADIGTEQTARTERDDQVARDRFIGRKRAATSL